MPKTRQLPASVAGHSCNVRGRELSLSRAGRHSSSYRPAVGRVSGRERRQHRPSRTSNCRHLSSCTRQSRIVAVGATLHISASGLRPITISPRRPTRLRTMGNVISSRSWSGSTAASQSALPYDPANYQNGAAVPLFLNEIEPETAPWSQESRCVTVQRFFGWLPESSAEQLKQSQRSPQYAPGAITLAVGAATTRTEALMFVQRWYRRLRARRLWYLVSSQVLEIARQQLEERALSAEEEEMLLNFRQILVNGFSAQKVSITGALKNIQLQLVLKAEKEECYLTWSPSRKRLPCIHLSEIQEVVPVSKEGNKHAPRLANKVSHRRGLIIVCKSHHRGRVVLQVSSKRERKVLLLGFKKLLNEMDEFAPVLDEEGAIRKRSPRRLSAVRFFEGDPSPASPSGRYGDKDSSSTSGGGKYEDAPVSEAQATRRLSKTSALLYQTRYDESFPGAEVPMQQAVAKPAHLRRSSLVM